MNQPTDFTALIGLLITQFAPYLISGPLLSHALAQLKFIDNKETPDWQKIGLAALVAIGAVFLNSLVTGGYGNGIAVGVAMQNTFQQAALLLGSMTIANVTMDNFLPSLSEWLVKVIATVRGKFVPGAA